jgi:hypothetical protein
LGKYQAVNDYTMENNCGYHDQISFEFAYFQHAYALPDNVSNFVNDLSASARLGLKSAHEILTIEGKWIE